MVIKMGWLNTNTEICFGFIALDSILLTEGSELKPCYELLE